MCDRAVMACKVSGRIVATASMLTTWRIWAGDFATILQVIVDAPQLCVADIPFNCASLPNGMRKAVELDGC